jgi:hypothetical protein
VLSEAPPCLGPTAALPPDRYSFGHHHGVTPPASPQSFHSRQRPFLPAGPRSRRGAPDSAASLTGAGFDIRKIHGPSGGVHRTAGSEGARWASIPHLDKPGAPGTDFIARCNIQGSGPASSQQAAESTPLLQWLRGQAFPTANYRNKCWCRIDPARPSRGNGRAGLVLMLPMGRASNRLLHILSQGTGRGVESQDLCRRQAGRTARPSRFHPALAASSGAPAATTAVRSARIVRIASSTGMSQLTPIGVPARRDRADLQRTRGTGREGRAQLGRRATYPLAGHREALAHASKPGRSGKMSSPSTAPTSNSADAAPSHPVRGVIPPDRLPKEAES